MADQDSKKGGEKKKKVVQIDEASSSSSTFSNESTLTDKSDTDFPKPPNSFYSPAEAPPPTDDPPPAAYDPTRIPSHIFSSRQAAGADWSANSNESLFSITIANNSFSRDHAFVVYKSGDLLRLDEVFSHPAAPSLGPKRQRDLAAVGSGGAVNAVSSKAPAGPAVKRAAENEEQGNKKPNPDDVGSCGASDESGASNCSFAFPILINNKAEPTAELPSLRPQGQSPEPEPGNAPTPKPRGLSGWLSCFFCCCPFRRK